MAQRKRPRKRYHNYPFGVALAACIGVGLILGAFFDQISWGAFIGVVIAATGYVAGSGLNGNIPVALGGIVVCGLVYCVVGLIVMLTGVKWIEKLMPPVVTGAVVAVIGLNLAPTACRSVGPTDFDAWMAVVTFMCVGGVAVWTRGFIQKLLILIGLMIAYFIYAVLANGFGMGKPIDFSIISNAAWFGVPTVHTPVFEMHAIALIVPVVIILVAENLGHVKAVTAMTGRNLDPYMGRAFLGDGIATMLSGSFGGTGVTTYGENIGVMAATRVYSTLLFPVAAIFAIILGFSPKFGAVIQTIPQPVLGGTSIVVFGLIAVAGARVWVVNKVDFGNSRNLIVAAVTLILGGGDFTLNLGFFSLGGIGTATFGAIILNAVMSLGEPKEEKASGEPIELDRKA